ncbi:ArsR family transcriptional regulator [Bacillus coahuilensis m2-6]|uniref:ArsR family transcriptional regulator n=1 Tax=Bacillus coahuilensis p1.1.43 TaxID=1150625 RepID=A0A147K9E5_9BACI|nr:transcriptional regulator SpxA [Bacillus coahuilensis]KUP07049.1 ArsR family transcriptional regulator [Bacillus coahuilensis p1.1.43]KUP08607.1 ArsR family transcriptional regulator [Bacillus coahuilensis m2-6]
MINLYITPSCASCRKAKAWFEEQGLEYKEINIFKEELTLDEFKAIIRMTEDGTSEIISERSKAFQELGLDIEDLSITELYGVVRDNPSILKRPIIMDEKRLQVGFNDEEIRSFLPRKVREYEVRRLLDLAN